MLPPPPGLSGSAPSLIRPTIDPHMTLRAPHVQVAHPAPSEPLLSDPHLHPHGPSRAGGSPCTLRSAPLPCRWIALHPQGFSAFHNLKQLSDSAMDFIEGLKPAQLYNTAYPAALLITMNLIVRWEPGGGLHLEVSVVG